MHADALIDELLGTERTGPVTTSRRRPSIHDVLAPRLRSAGGAALAPGPEVDRALGRLVQLLTSSFGPPGGDDWSALHWEVVTAAFDRIEHEPTLRARAGTVRRAAAVAEDLMERHYARLLVDTWRWPAGAGADGEELHDVLRPFPYGVNYRDLVAAERRGLGAHPDGSRIAFCGAGALPLTGILWHIDSGAHVTLIEVAPEVAVLADRCGPGGPLLLARSARGLTSQLAYEPVDLDQMAANGLVHVGTVAPAGSVSRFPLPARLAVRPDHLLRAIAAPTVLNTTDFFVAG